jgi:DNA-binding NtrC family response regulator
MSNPTKVLVLDHDPQTRQLLVEGIEKRGWTAEVAESGLGALELLEKGEAGVLVIDLEVPGLDGLEVVRRARRDHQQVDIVVIASSSAMTQATEAVRLGIPDYLIRPFGAVELKRVLSRLAEKRPAEGEATAPAAAEQGLRNLVGDSPGMLKVRQAILRAAERRLPVLILGETGTGKEVVARAIHACGPWRDEPFVPVDCGSLAPTLIESELFGHVRGAFTGATQSRPGLMVQAGRGTLFLDEIGELPVELQAKLLRVLQEREIRPVGSNERVPLEARLLAASNVDMEQAIRQGTFRRDLFYRLNVFTIRIPPLRERKSDVLALVHHFLKLYGSSEGVADFSPEFMQRLMQYDWPGNVRQLENSIQRALAVSSGVRLELKDVPSTILYRTESQAGTSDAATLQELERKAIMEALQAVGGDRVQAAKLLGIGKTTIYRKLKEYGLEGGPALSQTAQ